MESMENEIKLKISNSTKWKLKKNEFKNTLSVARIEYLDNRQFLVIDHPTTLEHYQKVSVGMLGVPALVLSPKEELALHRSNHDWQYYFNNNTSMKYEICLVDDCLRKAWNQIVTQRYALPDEAFV